MERPGFFWRTVFFLGKVIAANAAQPTPGCGHVEADTDYILGLSLAHIPDVHSADRCCNLCTEDNRCMAWTWGLQYPTDTKNTMCYLKTEAPTSVMKMSAPGVVSGLPGGRNSIATKVPTFGVLVSSVSIEAATVAPATTREALASTKLSASTKLPMTTARTTTTYNSAGKGGSSTTRKTTSSPALSTTPSPTSTLAPTTTPKSTTEAPTSTTETTTRQNTTTTGTTTTKVWTTTSSKEDQHGFQTASRTSFLAARTSTVASTTIFLSGQCGNVDLDTDYLAGEDLKQSHNAKTASDCCEECYRVPGCKSWTFGPGHSTDEHPSICYMKTSEPLVTQKKRAPGLVSGTPAKRKDTPSPPIQAGGIAFMEQCGGKNWKGGGVCGLGLKCVFINVWYSQCHRDPTAEQPLSRVEANGGTTIFCFSLVTPGTSEPGLMVQQWKLNAGLFACDGFAIISNVTADALFPDQVMASKVPVTKINAQLWAPMQPGSHGHMHALNTPVFIEAWESILKNGEYKSYDWTLKLDVDAVIVPTRVKALLVNRSRVNGRYSPMYLLNTGADDTGNFLHGPVEVLSKAAVDAYGAGKGRCEQQVDFSREGEDWFMNACMVMLKVPGVKELRLLQDAYIWGARQVECTSHHAVFHPAKSVSRWVRCVKQVGQAAIAAVPKALPSSPAFIMKYIELEDNRTEMLTPRIDMKVLPVAFTVAILAVAVVGLIALQTQHRTRRALDGSGEELSALVE